VAGAAVVLDEAFTRDAKALTKNAATITASLSADPETRGIC